jgi:hypothetical protein
MPNVMWALMGKLVPQLPGVVTFPYDLHFRRVIAYWEGNFDFVYNLIVEIQKNTI